MLVAHKCCGLHARWAAHCRAVRLREEQPRSGVWACKFGLLNAFETKKGVSVFRPRGFSIWPRGCKSMPAPAAAMRLAEYYGRLRLAPPAYLAPVELAFLRVALNSPTR